MNYPIVGESLLEIEGLTISVPVVRDRANAVKDLNLSVSRGEIVAIVGESGSGKTLTARSIMNLLPGGVQREAGQVRFRGRDIGALSQRELRALRGSEIGMIFQDPMTALNPLKKIGKQVVEALKLHDRSLSRGDARERATALLAEVSLPHPEDRMNQYPFEFSGGMLQRVMIAMALANQPSLLIADEPTTALDVSVQAEILHLIREASRSRDLAVILITHDLGVAAEMADRIVVMYAGRIVERAPIESLFSDPRHPYTVGLLGSIPRLDSEVGNLRSIDGRPPSPWASPPGCSFQPRCFLGENENICRSDRPELTEIEDQHFSACHFHEKVGGGRFPTASDRSVPRVPPAH